jgi:hypothetical protein
MFGFFRWKYGENRYKRAKSPTHNICPRPHKTPKAHPANLATSTSRTHTQSSRRPMPSSPPIVKKTDSFDSEDELWAKMCRTSADKSLHAETAHRLSSSPQASGAAAPTSYEGKSRRRMSRTRRKKSRLTRSCRNHTIADHHHRCHTPATESNHWSLRRENDDEAPPSSDQQIKGFPEEGGRKVVSFTSTMPSRRRWCPKHHHRRLSQEQVFTRICSRRPPSNTSDADKPTIHKPPTNLPAKEDTKKSPQSTAPRRDHRWPNSGLT